MNTTLLGTDPFTVEAGKYTPTIWARGNGGNYDLSTNTPEFCVGQLLTFEVDGLPSYLDSDQHWSLPGNYVNEIYQYSSSCSSYRQNTALLTNLYQQCWYVNKPGGTISVGINLHFSNGQYVSVACDGAFSIYRPTVSAFHHDQNGFEKLTFALQGTMMWDVTVDSDYPGFIGVTQIISCNNNVSDYYTSGYDLLDGDAEIYGEPNGSGPKQYDPDDPMSQNTTLGDTPWDPFNPCANMIANFTDYVRFEPSGGIFVTLATVNWHMNGHACIIGGIQPNDLPPADGPHDSDAFPLWDDVRPE